MVEYKDIKNKKENIKHILRDNFEILGTNLYVEYIDELTSIVCDLELTKYDQIIENLIILEEKINYKIETILNSQSLKI